MDLILTSTLDLDPELDIKCSGHLSAVFIHGLYLRLAEADWAHLLIMIMMMMIMLMIILTDPTCSAPRPSPWGTA